MTWRIITAGLVFFLLAAAALMVIGPRMKREAGPEKLPECPYLQREEFATVQPEVIAAIGAYEAIRETLDRGSLEGISPQAEVIARTFSFTQSDISSCAKRLVAEPDLESARRAFMRLNRLMEKHARKMPPAPASS